MNRRRLANRRASAVRDFEHGGQRFTASVSRFPDGTLAEIFINSRGKAGSAAETNAKDAAIAASLALQHGCPVETLRRALSRDARGNAGGPLSAVLDLLASEACST